jgi:carbonic anhydrase/acetyltransferase-like protein (isoleucine patch superfamily)
VLSGLGNFVVKKAEINYQSVVGWYALISHGQFESKAVYTHCQDESFSGRVA